MKKPLYIKNRILGQGKPLVCVPIMESTKDGIIREAKRLISHSVEMVEWRVDAFEQVQNLNAIHEVLTELQPLFTDTILIYTFRSRQQGGLLDLKEDVVYDIHQIAAESNAADLIDVELFTSKRPQKEIRILQNMGAYVIASHHDFEQTPKPEVMRELLSQLKESGADIIKLAVMPQSVEDVLSLLAETVAFHQIYPELPLITMSMGSLGCISRVAGETFGSCVTFGALGQSSAPGQLPMEELVQVLNTLHNGIEGE